MRLVLVHLLVFSFYYFFCSTCGIFPFSFFFFFNDTATTEIYTLSLHDALPILPNRISAAAIHWDKRRLSYAVLNLARSEEHTSELQSRLHLVCRLLLEKKKTPHTAGSIPLICSLASLSTRRSLSPTHDVAHSRC